MTRTTIFLSHPHLDQSTVNLRLAQAAEGLEGVQIRDMYSIYPDFEIDVDFEQNLLEETDRIILQFPMYWYSCPPLLKKWEDDVLTYGWAYGSTGDALHGKELLIATSVGAPASHYTRVDGGRRSVMDLIMRRPRTRDTTVAGYTVHDLLRPFQTMSDLVGTHYLQPFVTPGAATIVPADLEARAKAYARYVVSRKIPVLGPYG